MAVDPRFESELAMGKSESTAESYGFVTFVSISQESKGYSGTCHGSPLVLNGTQDVDFMMSPS